MARGPSKIASRASSPRGATACGLQRSYERTAWVCTSASHSAGEGRIPNAICCGNGCGRSESGRGCDRHHQQTSKAAFAEGAKLKKRTK